MAKAKTLVSIRGTYKIATYYDGELSFANGKNSIPFTVFMDTENKIAEIMQSKLSESEKEEAIYVLKKQFFARYDKSLHKYMTNDDFLNIPEIAQIVADKMHEYDKK